MHFEFFAPGGFGLGVGQRAGKKAQERAQDSFHKVDIGSQI